MCIEALLMCIFPHIPTPSFPLVTSPHRASPVTPRLALRIQRVARRRARLRLQQQLRGQGPARRGVLEGRRSHMAPAALLSSGVT